MSRITDKHRRFFNAAIEAATHATCLKASCGAAIALNSEIIATGFNEPAGGDIANRKCEYTFPAVGLEKPKSDRTCCIHAEHNAIIAAIKTGKNLRGSIMYFVRINKDGVMQYSGQPYCIQCAKMAYHHGISFWVLWHVDGIKVYDAKTYYELSIDFHNPAKK